MSVTLDGTGKDSTAVVADGIKRASSTTTELVLTGQHYVGDLAISNIKGVLIKGPGEVVRLPGASSLFEFTNVTNLSMDRLVLNFNSVTEYGGVKISSCTDIKLTKNKLSNGLNPPPVVDKDRYGFVFCRGEKTSKNILVDQNHMDGLQLELDHISGAEVKRNTLFNSAQTGAIGFFTLRDNSLIENAKVYDNLIVNPYAAAIAACVDKPDTNGSKIINLDIQNNTIVRNKQNPREGQHDIFLGTADVNQRTTGNVFRILRVSKNRSFTSADGKLPGAMVRFMAGEKSNFVFEEATIEANEVYNDTQNNLDSYTMDLRYLRSSYVKANILGKCNSGIALVNGKYVVLSYNQVMSVNGTPYTNDYSEGYNVFIRNLGGFIEGEQPNSTDIVIN